MVRRLLPALHTGRKEAFSGGRAGVGRSRCSITCQVEARVFLGSWDLKGEVSAWDQNPLSPWNSWLAQWRWEGHGDLRVGGGGRGVSADLVNESTQEGGTVEFGSSAGTCIRKFGRELQGEQFQGETSCLVWQGKL